MGFPDNSEMQANMHAAIGTNVVPLVYKHRRSNIIAQRCKLSVFNLQRRLDFWYSLIYRVYVSTHKLFTGCLRIESVQRAD